MYNDACGCICGFGNGTDGIGWNWLIHAETNQSKVRKMWKIMGSLYFFADCH